MSAHREVPMSLDTARGMQGGSGHSPHGSQMTVGPGWLARAVIVRASRHRGIHFLFLQCGSVAAGAVAGRGGQVIHLGVHPGAFGVRQLSARRAL